MQVFSQAIKALFVKCASAKETQFGQTPIHYAFKHGNIEVVMCLFAQIRAVMGFSSKDTNEIDKSA